MKPLNEMTEQELYDRLDILEESEAQDNVMDGSGELGGIIHKSYAPLYNEVYEEFNRRGIEPYFNEDEY